MPSADAGSRYQLFRRRIAPIAFFLALGFLGWQTCRRHERYDSTIILDLGARSEEVEQIEVDVWVANEAIASFSRNRDAAGHMGNPTFKATLTGKQAELTITLHLATRIVEVRRTIVAEDRATITVSLLDALDLPPSR